MSKVYLSPSNQDNNPYSYGSTNEMAQCNRIAEAAEKYLDRKSTRLNSSHVSNSYAVFCLKKKNKK